MARSGLETIIIKLRRKMLVNFKKQFKFSIRNRNRNPRKFISKLYNDQLINAFEYQNQLLHCRVCEKWAKAYLSNKRKCMGCTWNSRQTKTKLCVDWDIWSGGEYLPDSKRSAA